MSPARRAGFVYTIRPRYGEVDVQGVVFNAHWLAYFDDACTRFFEHLGYEPATAFFRDFDVMVVKATLVWHGRAGFDDPVHITVAPVRLGTASFDLQYRAALAEQLACEATLTYVSVRPGSHTSQPIPPELRERLASEFIAP